MRMNLTVRLSLFALVAAMVTICFARVKDASSSLSVATQDRMEDSGWWPTKGSPAASEYAGAAACAECHGDIAALQNTTPMYHAGMPASLSTFLSQHPHLTFQESPYNYSIQRTDTGVTYSANDGTSTGSRPAVWAFGSGEIGQTYLLKQNGSYIESRLSYYTAPNALDITTGHSEKLPSDLQHAFGQVMSSDTAQSCFSCHTTEAVTSGTFQPEKAIPGVTCESCHGPGAKHVAAMTAGQDKLAAATITNPASLSPEDSVDFCGACHRTSSDVTLFMPANVGIIAVRFQPYRLEKSRCWGSNGDARITCIACHDPHKPLVRDLEAYDAKCLACHRVAGQPRPRATAAVCKVSTKNCASCHMPRYSVPQTHASFTDHDIRVVSNTRLFPQ
jgi:hypothetical protein